MLISIHFQNHSKTKGINISHIKRVHTDMKNALMNNIEGKKTRIKGF